MYHLRSVHPAVQVANEGRGQGQGEAVEWVRLGETVVVATGRRSWLQPASRQSEWDAFGVPMSGEGTPASTRHLLDGALAAAARALPVDCHPPALTVTRWAWRLVGAYATTTATPPLMREAAARLARAGRHRVAEHCRSVSREEAGHDRLALRDLDALGYDALALVRRVVHPTAAALVSYFERAVRSTAPVRCLGYAYALERRASVIPAAYVAAVERVLPPGVRATRCLRVHSSLGSDGGHTESALGVISALPASDREEVAIACYETARLLGAPPDAGYPTDDELELLLHPYTTKGVSTCPRTP